MTIPQLPNETWRHIASFVDPKAFQSNPILSVNKVFLEVALNQRYETTDSSRPSRRTKFRLGRLSDPYIAKLLRTFKIDFTEFRKPPPPFKVLPVVHRPVVVELVANFTHLTNFNLTTNLYKNPEFLPAFTSACWATFGSCLERLSLSALVADFPLIIPPQSLPNLHALTLKFLAAPSQIESTVVNEEILSNTIAPFINRHSHSLEVLSITSSSFSDHSQFCHQLGEFPKLVSFSIGIGRFESALLPDISGLTRFCRRHSPTLKHLRLHPTTTSPVADNRFASWMHENVAYDDLFRNLETFVIDRSHPTVDTIDVDVVSPYIPRFQHTLVHLILWDRILSFPEIEVLVDQFSHRSSESGLKTLHLDALSLAPPLFDLLSSKLPGLHDLRIICVCLLLDPALKSQDMPTNSQDALLETHDDFIVAMQTRSYVAWKLRLLSIWRYSPSMVPLEGGVFEAIRTVIPSLYTKHNKEELERPFSVFE